MTRSYTIFRDQRFSSLIILLIPFFITFFLISGCSPPGNGGEDQGYHITLSVTPSNSGTVSISPVQDSYSLGDSITLTANYKAGFKFDHWAGDVSGTTNPLQVTVTGDLQIEAVFVQADTVDPQINSLAKVLDTGMTVVDKGNGQLEISGSGSNTIEKGQILVSVLNGGILAHVKSVTMQNGKAVVETEPAAITDVIKQGDANIQAQFDMSQAQVTFPAGKRQYAGKIGFSNGELQLSGVELEISDVASIKLTDGRFKFNPTFDFDMQIRDWKLNTFKCVAGGQVDLNVDIELSALKITDLLEKEVTLAEFSFPKPAGVFMVGYVPVVYEFFVELNLGAGVEIGSLGKINTGFDALTELQAGIEYANKAWNPIGQFTFQLNPHPPTLDLHPVSAEIYLTPEAGMRFYKIVGPSISYKDSLKLIGDYRYNHIGAELHHGMELNANLKLDILDKIKFTYEHNLYERDDLILARMAFNADPADLGTVDYSTFALHFGDLFIFDNPFDSTQATVTATGTVTDPNYEIGGWGIKHLCDSDTASRTGNPLVEPADASKLITVYFVPKGQGSSWSGAGGSGNPIYTITTEVFPAGAGTISLFPNQAKYPWSMTVLAQAKANANFVFHHWELDLSGSDEVSKLTMNGNKNIRAVFASIVPRELRVPQDYGTIQAALDAATYNDKVLLAAGTYSGNGNRDLNFHGRNISIDGAGIDQSIVDLAGAGTGKHIFTSLEEVNNLKFTDMTIKNGSGLQGIPVIDLSKLQDFTLENVRISNCTVPVLDTSECSGLTLKNCQFIGNTSSFKVVNIANAQIDNCKFQSNTTEPLEADNSTITQCTFLQNSAQSDDPAGIHASNCQITNCTFTSNTGGTGAIEAENSDVTDCQFSQNKGLSTGGAIYSQTARIVNCTFTGNVSEGRGGGAIDASQGNDNSSIRDCTFESNSTTSYGGAVYGKSIAVLNSAFTANKADKGGGAVFCQGEGSFSDCTFNQNQAKLSGGAIDANTSTLIRCQITNNKLTGSLTSSQTRSGAGASVTNSFINHCTIDSNQADTDTAGGLNAGNTWIIDTTISNNKVLANGNIAGGLHANQCFIISCRISNNSMVGRLQSWGGGGGYIENSYVRNCSFTGNQVSGGKGGGLVGRASVLSSCTITGNSTTKEGGGAHLYDSEIYSSTVSQNQAGTDGGGLYLEGDELLDGTFHGLIHGCTVQNNQARNGGGIYARAATINSTTISGNTAQYVGGLYASGVNVVSCRILNNVSPKGAGVNLSGLNDVISTISNSEIAGNSSSGGLSADGTTVTNCNIHDNVPNN